MNKPLCISLTLALLSLTHASLHNEQPSETAQAASKSREASPSPSRLKIGPQEVKNAQEEAARLLETINCNADQPPVNMDDYIEANILTEKKHLSAAHVTQLFDGLSKLRALARERGVSTSASPRRRSASQPPATKQHAAATNANNNPPAQNSNDTQPLPPVTKRTSPEDTGCCGFGAKKKA